MSNATNDIIITSPIYTTLICGYFSSLSIDYNRNVYAFGKNDSGILGYKNDITIIENPKQIKELVNIKMIDCGRYHSVCCDYDGNVFSFGSNSHGQLGRDTTKSLPHTPTKINITNIDKISCGNSFTICLSFENELWVFGLNNYGQLGLGNNNKSIHEPTLLPNINNIDLVDCGHEYSICKTFSNEIYSFGRNQYGQLGNGTFNDRKKPILCNNWPDNIISICCGYSSIAILTAYGTVYTCGSNTCGKLGNNDGDMKKTNIPILIEDIPLIKRLSIGLEHIMCIDIDNNLYSFGLNSNGQLGVRDCKHRKKPTFVASDIIDVSSGGDHTLIKTSDNKIYGFGKNDRYQLGIDSNTGKQIEKQQILIDNEDIWCSNIGRSRQKSARK